MKLLAFFIAFTMLVFSVTTTYANPDCTGNTADCTPLQLCEASTTVIDGNTVWSDDPVFARHVATAKQIGLDCGVQEITEPTCETDAELCTIVALCEQATKQLSDGSSITWSDERTEHVRLAQEYGLECGVTASPEQIEVAEMPANADELSDSTICGLAAMTHIDATMWQAIAESRSLTCSVNIGEVTTTSAVLESAESVEEYSDLTLCNLIRADPHNDQVSVWREETYSRRLNCILLLGLPTREEAVSTFSDTSLCHFMRTDPQNYDAAIWQNEATARGLECGLSDVLQEVRQLDEGVSTPLEDRVARYHDTTLCNLLEATPQHARAPIWESELNARGLDCAVEETTNRSAPVRVNTALSECPTSGRLHNCYGTRIQDDGDRWIGTWVNNSIKGIATLIIGPGDWEGDVHIGMKDGSYIHGGQSLYVHSRGGWVHFERNYNRHLTNAANSNVNDVFPILTRSFQSLTRSERLTIHNSLARKGLYDAAIDGVWGRNTLIGIARFAGEHLNSINLKSSENVRLVLDAIKDQAELNRTEVASSSILRAVRQRDAAATSVVSTDFRNPFQNQTRLKRQQLQYALRELGMYSSSIDGIWGDRTSSAFVSFVQENGLHNTRPDDVFEELLSLVDVPNSFAAPRSNSPNRPGGNTPSNSSGLTAIVSNPSMPAAQALAVCRPQAELARTQASNAYTPPSYGYSGNCTGFGNNYNCNVQQNSGGFWGGFAEGISREIDGRAAYNSVLRSCLAQYGWRN